MAWLESEDAPAPLTTRYAVPGYSAAAHRTKPFQFCDVCQINQHKYTTSLAQLDVLEEPKGSKHQESLKALHREKARLEKLYPQVCADCAPGAYGQIVSAQKLARNDYVRRKLIESSFRKFAGEADFSSLGVLLLAARLLWIAGIVGQVLWNLGSFFICSPLYQIAMDKTSVPRETVEHVVQLISSSRWALVSLQLSLLSCWYSPHYKHAHNGFWTVIEGFKPYYVRSASLLVIRIACYATLTSQPLTKAAPEVLQLAHLLEMIYVIVVWCQFFRYNQSTDSR